MAPGKWEVSWIYRKYCCRCRVSFSLLPQFLLRRQSYSLSLVAAWLWAWLNGASTRQREFYLSNQVELPAVDQKLSWSDLF
ncbi:MAG: hypothetical protein AB7S38_34300 [Vulcanimicrobiota bacterium]